MMTLEMTMTGWQIFTFTIAMAVFIASPGPGVFATIAKGMTHGAKSVFPLSIGMALSDTLYLILAIFGLTTVATNFYEVFVAIKYIGAAYLIYLGWSMWNQSTEITEQPLITSNNFGRDILTGFLISLSNPKVILFYVSLLPSFFPIETLNAIDILIVSTITMAMIIVVIMAYGFLASYAKKQLTQSRARQRFNRSGASLMIAAGVWLAYKG
jgi:threonine/homoserine/homoserine lactone efflux protein